MLLSPPQHSMTAAQRALAEADDIACEIDAVRSTMAGREFGKALRRPVLPYPGLFSVVLILGPGVLRLSHDNPPRADGIRDGAWMPIARKCSHDVLVEQESRAPVQLFPRGVLRWTKKPCDLTLGVHSASAAGLGTSGAQVLEDPILPFECMVLGARSRCCAAANDGTPAIDPGGHREGSPHCAEVLHNAVLPDEGMTVAARGFAPTDDNTEHID